MFSRNQTATTIIIFWDSSLIAIGKPFTQAEMYNYGSEYSTLAIPLSIPYNLTTPIIHSSCFFRKRRRIDAISQRIASTSLYYDNAILQNKQSFRHTLSCRLILIHLTVYFVSRSSDTCIIRLGSSCCCGNSWFEPDL